MPAVKTSQIPSRADEPQTTLQKALLSLISNRRDSLSEAVTSPQQTSQATLPETSTNASAVPKNPPPGRHHLPPADAESRQLLQHLNLISVLLTPVHRRPMCHFHRFGMCRFGSQCYYNHSQRTPEIAVNSTVTASKSCSHVHPAVPVQSHRTRAYAFHTTQHSIDTHLPPTCPVPTQFSCRAILFDTQISWTTQTFTPPKQPSRQHQNPEHRSTTSNHLPRRTRATIYQASQAYVEALYHPPRPRCNQSTDASQNSRFKSHTVWELLTDEGSSQSCEEEDEDWSAVTKPITKPPNRYPVPKASTHCCVECYRKWTLEESTEHWYRDKGWPIPKRCQPCRNLRKNRSSRNNLKAPQPLHIHQVSLGGKKGWTTPKGDDRPAEEQEHHLTLRSPPTPSSSQTPSPPRGRFWDDTEDSDVPASPIQQELQLYWNDNIAVYDTPAEQQSLLSSKGSAYRQSLSEVLSTIFRTHLLTNETWHINARPAVLFPYIPADSGTTIEGTTPETSPHTTHPILSATSRCNSDSDIELPDLQSSSSDDSDAQSARHTGTRSDSLESFNLLDLATNSLRTWDSQCSPEDLNADQKNIYAILATLCTGHDLLAIQGLYRLYEELPWFPRGKDLSSDSLVEILFDSSLHTPSLIKYLKSSKVPHTTVEMCIKIRATDTFPKMQAVYHELIEKKQ